MHVGIDEKSSDMFKKVMNHLYRNAFEENNDIYANDNIFFLKRRKLMGTLLVETRDELCVTTLTERKTTW